MEETVQNLPLLGLDWPFQFLMIPKLDHVDSVRKEIRYTSQTMPAQRYIFKTTTYIPYNSPNSAKNPSPSCKMRPILFTSLFAIVAVAIPLAIEIEGGKHLGKRGTDTIIADFVKAVITFGAFIWGGEIIAKRAVNYYFVKKDEVDQLEK